jgi:hypothetical protein
MQDESTWPTERTYAAFREWFDVEVHSVVIDLVAGEPLLDDEDDTPPEKNEEP